jgi:hypothetical protein
MVPREPCLRLQPKLRTVTDGSRKTDTRQISYIAEHAWPAEGSACSRACALLGATLGIRMEIEIANVVTGYVCAVESAR